LHMAMCYRRLAVESNPYPVDFKGGQSYGERQQDRKLATQIRDSYWLFTKTIFLPSFESEGWPQFTPSQRLALTASAVPALKNTSSHSTVPPSVALLCRFT